MAWEVKSTNSGEDVTFRYRSMDVGGRPTVHFGKYEMPLIEFIGVMTHYLRQETSKKDYRHRWLRSLHNIKINFAFDAGWYIDFSDVHAEMEAEVIPFRTSREIAAEAPTKVTSETKNFQYGSYSIEPEPFCTLIEYFYTNYFIHSPDDPRLVFFEAILADWNAHKKWEDETKGEIGRAKIEASKARREKLRASLRLAGFDSPQKAKSDRPIAVSTIVFICLVLVGTMILIANL